MARPDTLDSIAIDDERFAAELITCVGELARYRVHDLDGCDWWLHNVTQRIRVCHYRPLLPKLRADLDALLDYRLWLMTREEA